MIRDHGIADRCIDEDEWTDAAGFTRCGEAPSACGSSRPATLIAAVELPKQHSQSRFNQIVSPGTYPPECGSLRQVYNRRRPWPPLIVV